MVTEEMIKNYVSSNNVDELKKLILNYNYQDTISFYTGYYGNIELIKSGILNVRNNFSIMLGAIKSEKLYIIEFIHNNSDSTINWCNLANIAAEYGSLNILKYILQKFEYQDYNLYSMIINAIYNKNIHIVKYILSLNRFNKETKFNIFLNALEIGNLEIVKYIVKN